MKIIDIYDLLVELKKRPGMFLGNGYNFQSLSSFITGYLFGRGDKELSKEPYNDFGYFNTWIVGHLSDRYSSLGWYWFISERNPNDDEKAFAEFFEFLEVFKNSKKSVSELGLGKEMLEELNIRYGEGDLVVQRVDFANSKSIYLEVTVNGKAVSLSWFMNEEDFNRGKEGLRK